MAGKMRGLRRRRLCGAGGIAGATAVAAAMTLTGLVPPASAAPAGNSTVALAGARALATTAQPPGAVSPHPASGTPELVPKTTNSERIRQLVQCGGTMYAVGNFTTIVQGSNSYTRNNIFSFSATSPYTVTSWNPNVNGIADSIAFEGSNCADAYIGGNFTSVNGTAVSNIAEVNTTTGNVVPTFGHNANKEVFTLAVTSTGHLLAGGKFTSINGSTAAKYMASLNPVTGADDGFLRLNISGHYHYCSGTKCSVTFPTQVYNQQLSHNGNLDLAEGVFTSVGGKARQQIFMLNLNTNPATVTGWTSPEWDGSQGNLPGGYPYQCWWTESFYLRAAAWSPGDNTIYTASTGFHPWNQGTGSTPRTGLCDSVAAFPATQTSVLHTWINYTGCDSLFSVAADSGAVYVAGHPRWGDNSDGCNFAGTGAVADAGMQGHSVSTGRVLTKTDGNPVYFMSRNNWDSMPITSAGLWIGGDNRSGQFCDGIPDHAGICFLPYS